MWTGGVFLGEATKLTTCHFHILTQHLLTDDACWRTSFRPWSRFLHSDFCDKDNYSRTAQGLPALPAITGRQEFILLFKKKKKCFCVLREWNKSLGHIYINYKGWPCLTAVQVKAQEMPDALQYHCSPKSEGPKCAKNLILIIFLHLVQQEQSASNILLLTVVDITQL